jgi:hypothetical protein
MVGHLNKNHYKLVGSLIPYEFHDTNFADLFYDPVTQQLIAVTLLQSSEDYTVVQIYTLLTPLDIERTGADYLIQPSKNNPLAWTAISALIIATLIFFVRRKKHKQFSSGILKTEKTPVEHIGPDEYQSPGSLTNAIYLFGDMQLITPQGENVAEHFTSLLNELFLVILINSLKSERGVTPEKLAELLWPHKTKESAKNNRATNISKLKSLLCKVGNIHLSKSTGKWKLEIDHVNIYFDYHHFNRIVAARRNLTKRKILELMVITARGGFLTNFQYPWLDQIKSSISVEVIDIYLEYACKVNIEDDPEFLIKLANSIFFFDKVSEEAMVIKCQSLLYLGKLSQSKATFDVFVKDFKDFYAEPFGRSFQDICEQPRQIIT